MKLLFSLANHAAPAAALPTLVNYQPTPAFTREELAAGVWVPLALYGDLPNVTLDGRRVTQRFTPEDAAQLVNEWKSMLTRLTNWRGAPWYAGHPDQTRGAAPDVPALARTKQIEARPDGLYGLTKFNEEGVSVIANEQFAGHSIRWGCEETEPGIMRPRTFISVGFTENPNMQHLPPVVCSNAEPGDGPAEESPSSQEGSTNNQENTMPDWLTALLTKLGVIKEGQTPEEQQAAITAFFEKAAAPPEGDKPAEEAAMTNARKEISDLRRQLAKGKADALVSAGRLIQPLANQYQDAAAAAATPQAFAAVLADMDSKAGPAPKTGAALANAAPASAAFAAQQHAASDKDARIAAHARELRGKGVPADQAYRDAVAAIG